MSSKLLFLKICNVFSLKTAVQPLSQSCPMESSDSLFRHGNNSEDKGSAACSFKSPQMIAVIVVLSGQIA